MANKTEEPGWSRNCIILQTAGEGTPERQRGKRLMDLNNLQILTYLMQKEKEAERTGEFQKRRRKK
jgi:hypothetical protein